MNSLGSVLEILNNYLQADVRTSEVSVYFTKKNFPRQVYESLFKWITDPIQSPENIIHLLDTCLCGFEGFSTSRTFQPLVAFTCIEALVKIQPAVLIGPWEHLVYSIVKYYCTADGHRCTFNEVAHPTTWKWVLQYSSHKLCPNPCLRLELLNLFHSYLVDEEYEPIEYNEKKYRKVLLSTIYEISSKYSSLSMDQIVRCNARDMGDIFLNLHITMDYIRKKYSMRSRIKIALSIIKLAGMYASLERERNIRTEIYGEHIQSCVTFFGISEEDMYESTFFKSDPDLGDGHDVMAESLNAIYVAFIHLGYNDQEEVMNQGNIYFRKHCQMELEILPLYQPLREIQGRLLLGLH